MSKKAVASLLAGLLLTQGASALEGSMSAPPGVTEGSGAFGGGGLEIPNEIPNIVGGHNTIQVPKRTYQQVVSYGGGWFTRTDYSISPPYRVEFRNDGTPILRLGAHVASYDGNFRAFYAGSYALSKYGPTDGGYRYCTGKRYRVGRLCVIVRFDGVSLEPFFQASGNYSYHTYGWHSGARRTYWHKYAVPAKASWRD